MAQGGGSGRTLAEGVPHLVLIRALLASQRLQNIRVCAIGLTLGGRVGRKGGRDEIRWSFPRIGAI